MEMEIENENNFNSVDLENTFEDNDTKIEKKLAQRNLFEEIDNSRKQLRAYIKNQNAPEVRQKIEKYQNKMKSVTSILTLMK